VPPSENSNLKSAIPFATCTLNYLAQLYLFTRAVNDPEPRSVLP
jgi:hypothetical protein